MGEWKEYPLKTLGSVITGKTPSKNNPEDWGDEMPFDVSYLPILNSSSLFRSSISVWMLSWYRRDLINRLPLPVISPDGRMKQSKAACRTDLPG